MDLQISFDLDNIQNVNYALEWHNHMNYSRCVIKYVTFRKLYLKCIIQDVQQLMLFFNLKNVDYALE
jgi:hypothetical protein